MAFDINTAVLEDNSSSSFDINTATLDEVQNNEDAKEQFENVQAQAYFEPLATDTQIFKKPENVFESFQQAFHWLTQVPVSAYKSGYNNIDVADLEMKGIYSGKELNTAQLNQLEKLQTQSFGRYNRENNYQIIDPEYNQKDPFTILGAAERIPNLSKKWYAETFSQLPIMIESIKSGGAGGVIGGGAGAVIGAGAAIVGGQLGPQVATPEEIVTVPTAAIQGAKRGFLFGGRVGAAKRVFELEAGLTKNELRTINKEIENEGGEPLSEQELNLFSIGVGGVNAGLEIASLEKLLETIPNGKQIIDKLKDKQLKSLVKNPTVRQQMLDVLKKYGTAALAEASTEAAQEATNIIAGETVRKLGELEPTPMVDNVKRVIDAGSTGFGVALFLGGVGSTAQTITILTKKGVSKQEATEIANGMTPEERHQFVDENSDVLLRSVEDLPEVKELQAKEMYKESLFKQAKQAGYDDVRANTNAELIAESFANLAKQTGMSIEDIQNEANIVIQNLSDQEAIQQFNEDSRKVLQGRVEEVRHQFVGEKSETANKYSLQEAQRQLNDGIDAETVRQQTGWFKGVDGKFRYEISDNEAEFTELFDRAIKIPELWNEYTIQDAKLTKQRNELRKQRDELDNKLSELYEAPESEKEIAKLQKEYTKLENKLEKINKELNTKRDEINNALNDTQFLKVGDVLKHDKLFAAYPELKNTYIKFEKLKDNAQGYYSEVDDEIVVDSSVSKDEALEIIMHEIQHFIQYREGFAIGGNPSSIERLFSKVVSKIENSSDLIEYENLMKEYSIINDALLVHSIGSKPENITKSYWWLQKGKGWYAPKKTKKNDRKAYIDKACGELLSDLLEKNKEKGTDVEYQEYLEKDTKVLKNKANSLHKKAINKLSKVDIKTKEKFKDALEKVKEHKIDADFLYRRLAGEVEARATEKRLDLTEEQRYSSTYNPYNTALFGYDYSPEEQYVVFSDGTSVPYRSNSYKENENKSTRQKTQNLKNVIDWTDKFEKVPSFKEVEEYLLEIMESGKDFNTLSSEWKIDIKNNNRTFKKLSNKDNFQKLNVSKNKRHKKYISGIKELIENSVYSHPDTNVKPNDKKFINAYHYFNVNVKIGDKVYFVQLECEEYKKDVPQGKHGKRANSYRNNKKINQTKNKVKTVHLYNIVEVKSNDAIYFQSAYHGTPHRFDEFLLDHIGTGEGAQAHGWGLYFAGNKDVSEEYRRRLTQAYGGMYHDLYLYETSDNKQVIIEYKNKPVRADIDEDGYLELFYQIKTNGKEKAKKYLEENNYPDYTIDEIDNVNPDDINIVYTDNIIGQLFEVDIPENDVLLDEDKVISEQPEIIKKAFQFEQNELIKNLSAYQLTFKALTNNKNINIKEIYQTNYWNEAFEKFKKNPEKYIDYYYSSQKVTGKKLYDDIANRLHSPKKASLYLNELGIKGITYDGLRDGRCYVIFDDKAVNVIKTYYQSIEDDSNLNDTERGIINSRGFTYEKEYFDGQAKENIIVLLKNKADASTLIHEFAHVYLITLNNLSRNNVKAKELLLTVNKWLRYDGREYTTAQHEKFANGFVAYVKAGKAPSYGLKRVFENFRRWLGDIWNSASQSDEFEIDEEYSKVFNQLLGDVSVQNQDEMIEKIIDDAKQNASLRLLNENIEKGDVKFNELTETQRRHRDTAYEIIFTALKNSKDEETRNYVQSIQDLRMKLGSGSTKSLQRQKERIEFLLSELDDPFSASDGFHPEWGEFFTDPGVSYDNQEVGADAELALDALDVIVNKKYLFSDNNFGELSEREVKQCEYEYEYILNQYKYANDKTIPMTAFYQWTGTIHPYLQDEFYKKWENETNEIDRYQNLSKFEQAKEDLKYKAAQMQGLGDYSKQFAEYAREIIKRLDFMTERDKARIFDKLKDFNSFREVQANLDDVMDFAETLYNVTERRKIADDIIREVKQTIHEWKDGIKRTKYTYPANKLFERLRELNKLPQQDIQDIYDAQVNEEIKPTYEADKVNTDDYYETIEKMFIEFKANGVYYNSSEFLQDLLTRIQNAKFTAKIARDEMDFERRMQAINLIDDCAKAVAKHKGKTSTLEKLYRLGFNLNSALEMMFDKNTKEKFTLDYLYAQKDAKVGADRDVVLKRLKDVFGFQGKLSDTFLFNQFINMTKKEFTLHQRYTPDIAQGVIRQTHRDKETGLQFTDKTIEYSKGKPRTEWQAEEIQLSRMELLYYYILSMNEDTYNILTDMGSETQAPKGQFDKYELEEKFNQLTPQEKMMGVVLQQAAEKYWPELNRYHIKKYHTELGKTKNYFPRKTELTEVKPLELFNDYVQYSGKISAQKQRTAGLGSRIAPANALAVLFDHIEKANTLITMGEQLDLMNRVFKEPNLKKKIEAVWGIDTTNEFYNHIAGNLYSGQQSIISDAEKHIGRLSSNVIKAQIFAKAQVGLKQIISFLNYGTGDEFVSSSEWGAAFWKQSFTPKEWKKNIEYMINIPYLKDRFGRGGSTDALKRELETRLFAKMSLLDDFFSLPIKIGDMGAIILGGKPYIDVLIKKGYTEEQAQKIFIEKTVNEMQSSIPSTLSNMQRNAAKQPIVKMIFAYQNTPWQYFRVAANSIIQFKQNPNKYTGLNMVKIVGLYMYVFPLIFNLASSFSPLTGDEDELIADLWKSALGNFMFIPYGGMFIMAILNGALGERISTGNWFDTAAAKAGNMARKIAKGDDITVVDMLKVIALFGEMYSGLPLTTLGTEVSGVYDIATGSPTKGALKVAGYSDYRAKKVSGEEK